MRSIEGRFWSKIEKTENCWIWKGTLGKENYGQFRITPRFKVHKTVCAHRFSYELHFGVIPIGMLVLHKCDNPSCVNPDHLEIGDQSKNISDCVTRGRYATKRGSNHPSSKVTEEQVLEMRSEYDGKWGSVTRLSKLYGISQPHVSEILSRKMWKHI